MARCLRQRAGMSPDGQEDGLNGPEFGGRIEPAVEYERRILTIPGDGVFPRLGKPAGAGAQKVAERGLTEPIEMLMGAQEHRRLVEPNARFLTNLADRCCADTLTYLDSTGGNLSACFRVISMVEDEQAVFSFDVDDDAMSHCHRQIVGAERREGRPRRRPLIRRAPATTRGAPYVMRLAARARICATTSRSGRVLFEFERSIESVAIVSPLRKNAFVTWASGTVRVKAPGPSSGRDLDEGRPASCDPAAT